MKMRRKLLGAAIAGVFCLPGLASAQGATAAQGASDRFQLYGGLDLSLVNVRLSSSGTTPSVSRNVLYNSGLRTIFGFRGQQPLANELTFWYQAESTLFAEGRINAGNQPLANFGGRNAGIGLRGKTWGDVMVGQWDAPYKLNTYPALIPSTLGFASGAGYGAIVGNATGSGYGDTTGSLPNPNCQNLTNAAGAVATGPQPLCSQTEPSTTGWVRRLSNTLQYWSPSFAGLRFRIATQMNEEKSGTTSQDPKLWSTSLRWDRGGPLVLGVAYETHKDFQFAGGKDKAWGAVGSYYFAPRTMVGAYYERINTNGPAAGLDINARNFGVVGTFGIARDGEVVASFAKAKDPSGAGATPNAGGRAWHLGYRHYFTKETDMYVAIAKLDNNSGGTRTLMPINNSAGVPAGISPGQDTRAIGVGIAHTF
jgi:predicted porin